MKRVFTAIELTALTLLTLALPTAAVVALWHLFAPKTVASMLMFVLVAEVLWLLLAAAMAHAVNLWFELRSEEEEEEYEEEDEEYE